MHNPWLRLTLASANLASEAWRVVGLRMVELAAGGEMARREAARFVPEKVAALLDAQMGLGIDIALGQSHLSAQRTVAMYRRRVRENYRRLSR
jgi:hypothetical protein